MRRIPLTKGFVAKVDDEDYDYLMQYKWCTHSSGYAITNIQRGEQMMMHRLIMDAPPGTEVDHRDFDRLNNQKSNLTVMSRRDNNKNRLPYKNNKSGFKGVTFKANKWRAAITVDGKHIHLGTYEDIIDAARSYDAAAIKHFGKYSRTNL